MTRRFSVIVAGAGITGLSAVHRLTELDREHQFDLDITLLDPSPDHGGAISTVQQDGCLLELGPDAMFTEKPWGMALCKRLGLESEMIGTAPGLRTSFVAIKSRLLPVPEGFYLVAPGKIWPMMTSRIFSLHGKMRAMCDLFIPARKEITDESLGSFVQRRLGKSARRMAQPWRNPFHCPYDSVCGPLFRFCRMGKTARQCHPGHVGHAQKARRYRNPVPNALSSSHSNKA